MTDEEVQEAVAMADAEYDMLKDRVHEQYDEIEKLKEDVEYYKSSRDELISSNAKLREEKLRLNNIINKAIEYTTRNCYKVCDKQLYGMPIMSIKLDNADNLLDILKGVDKE